MCNRNTAAADNLARTALLERLELQPELADLERCLRLMLANFPSFDPRNPYATLLEKLPVAALGSSVSLMRYQNSSASMLQCT